MKKILKKILDEIIDIDELDDYDQAINSLFIGTSQPLAEYHNLLKKYFTEISASEIICLSKDCENVIVSNVSNDIIEILVFGDDYEGSLFSIGCTGDKLDILSYTSIKENDPFYNKVNNVDLTNIL